MSDLLLIGVGIYVAIRIIRIQEEKRYQRKVDHDIYAMCHPQARGVRR